MWLRLWLTALFEWHSHSSHPDASASSTPIVLQSSDHQTHFICATQPQHLRLGEVEPQHQSSRNPTQAHTKLSLSRPVGLDCRPAHVLSHEEATKQDGEASALGDLCCSCWDMRRGAGSEIQDGRPGTLHPVIADLHAGAGVLHSSSTTAHILRVCLAGIRASP